MKHTQEEILDALQVIKDTCDEIEEQKEGCYKCPFSRNGLCIILDKEPSRWELNFEGAVWRAFK